jgi:menaquinone-specific isochorismate synthase
MRAHTVELDPAEPVDLVAFSDGTLWLQGEGGLAGRGCALRIELPDGLAGADAAARVMRALSAFDVDDEVVRPATGPVALGALPFDRDAPCALVVPEMLVGRSRDGRQWLTTIDGAGARAGDALAAATRVSARPQPSPDGFALSSPRSHDAFRELVGDAVKAIDANELGKVVLAREVLVETNRPIVAASVVERLHALYPSCTVFAMDGFVGASPELLVERRAEEVHAHPLAGTFPRSGDAEADELLAARLRASVKDGNEHRFVIDELRRVLGARCDRLDVPDAPEIMLLRNVLHLGTDIRGHLRAPAPSAIELAAELHPTPAVAGTPTDAALQWLADHEGLDRARYAGPVGWVDRHGDGSFVVGIRSAEIDAEAGSARLFAGVGIVAGSEPQDELVETQLKLQALLAALVRP